MAAEVRAQCLGGVTTYLNTLSPEVRSEILSTYSPELRAALEEPSPNVYFPIEYWSSAIDSIVAIQPNIQQARQEVRKIGVCISEGIANSFLKLLMRIMTPSLFAKKCAAIVGRDFRGFPTGGDPEVDFDLSKESAGELLLTLKGVEQFKYLGGCGRGFIEFAFNYMGKKNLVIDEPNCADDEWAPSVIQLRVRWS